MQTENEQGLLRRSDALTLEEILASTDLSGKIASAGSLKDFKTSGIFMANLSVGTNAIKSSGVATDRVISGTLPSSDLCIINTKYITANNDFYWSYHFDSEGKSLYIYTNVAQSIAFEWIEFNS